MFMHAYTQTSIHTYIHTYTRTYIRALKHARTHARSNTQTHAHALSYCLLLLFRCCSSLTFPTKPRASRSRCWLKFLTRRNAQVVLLFGDLIFWRDDCDAVLVIPVVYLQGNRPTSHRPGWCPLTQRNRLAVSGMFLRRVYQLPPSCPEAYNT